MAAHCSKCVFTVCMFCWNLQIEVDFTATRPVQLKCHLYVVTSKLLTQSAASKRNSKTVRNISMQKVSKPFLSFLDLTRQQPCWVILIHPSGATDEALLCVIRGKSQRPLQTTRSHEYILVANFAEQYQEVISIRKKEIFKLCGQYDPSFLRAPLN